MLSFGKLRRRSQNLATINRLLAESTTDYEKVNEEWQVAKNYLADVLVMKPADTRCAWRGACRNDQELSVTDERAGTRQAAMDRHS